MKKIILLFTMGLLWSFGTYASCDNADSFITTWKTTSQDETITIPTFLGETYSYTVDWGDGNSDAAVTGDITHTYTNSGSYTVKICGTFPRIYFNNDGDKLKLRIIEQWGPNVWSSMNGAFAGARNLVSNATDMPNLSMVNDMFGMFAYASTFNGDSNIGNWNVSNVTNMDAMFAGASKFNKDINGWNVGNVTTMEDMFNGATKFNKNLNGWNVGNVTNMTRMFKAALNFNGTIGNWNVSNVTTMRRMFSRASGFNQDISGWNVSNVTNMRNVFAYARMFNSNIGNWNVSNATDMEGMFSFADNFNQDLGGWNVGNVTNMYGMFAYARKFNQNIGGWDVSKVTNMYGMFAAGSVFNQNIGGWDVSNVTNMESMFNGATLFNQELGSWNVGNVKNMKDMFRTALHFNGDISNWNVGNVKDMEYMFAYSIRFDQNLGAWNVENVMKMHNMFKNVKLSTLNYDNLLNGWSTRSLKSGVKFSGGNSNYCTGETARTYMMSNFGWIISDGGKDCTPLLRPTGTEALAADTSLSGVVLYPNPMADQLILNNSQNIKLDTVSIYDLTGRLIQTVDLKGMSSEKSLDVSNLSPATYMVLIQGESGQISKLVIKQ